MEEPKPNPAQLSRRNVGFFLIVTGMFGLGYMAWLTLGMF
jgi:hypothetical protein